MPRAPGSRPFDGDGLATRRNAGRRGRVLRTFLCDVYSARKLGRQSTGSAGRGIGGSPHVTTSNFILQPGRTPAPELEKLDRGLYVTELMGFGFNAVTGDYSQGAGGLLDRKRRARRSRSARSPSPPTSTICGRGSTRSATIWTRARPCSARPSACRR